MQRSEPWQESCGPQSGPVSSLAIALSWRMYSRQSDCQIARPAAIPRGTHLLPQLQNLEPLEVIELPPLLELSALLCPGGLLELGVHLRLLPCLLQSADTGSAGELGDDDRGKRNLGESCGVSGHDAGLRGSVNEHLDNT